MRRSCESPGAVFPGAPFWRRSQNTSSDNIYIQPGDEITLERRPNTFSAFGAVRNAGLFPFGTTNLNLLEAVGMVSGLDDQRADSKGVFLFRYEPGDVATRLSGQATEVGASGLVPVVYQVNLRDANQYFLAQSVAMKNRDVIYVSNASAAEFAKFVSILNPAVGTYNNGIGR